MKRFLLFWAVLAATGWVAGTGVDLAVFRRLDWTFEAFAAALFVPAAQSAAVCLLAPVSGAVSVGKAMRTVSAPVAIRVLLGADAALIVAGFLAPSGSLGSAGRPSAAIALATAAHAGAAGLIALLVAVREGKPRERAALAAAGVAALAAAAAGLPRAAGFLLPRAAAIVRVLVLGAGGFAAGIGLLLAGASALSRRHPAAARGLEVAAGFALAAGAIAAVNLFRFPRVMPPWDGVVRALLLAAAAFSFASMVSALRPEIPADAG